MPVLQLILQAAVPLVSQLSQLITLAGKADKLDVAEVEAEIERIKNWSKSASEADWAIVKKGKRK